MPLQVQAEGSYAATGELAKCQRRPLAAVYKAYLVCGQLAQIIPAWTAACVTLAVAQCGLACRKSVTAVALTADDSAIYSVSKDGSVAHIDVATGRRCCSVALT